MANYNYEGTDAQGKRVAGIISAIDEKEVRKTLHGQRIRVIKITLPFDEIEWGKLFGKLGVESKFEPKILLNFTKQLAVMINSGIPVMQAFEILQKSERDQNMKKAIRLIGTSIAEGKTISEAMSVHPGFNKTYRSLVKAGEAGGMLDGILTKLAIHMEKQAKIKQQIKSALTYPSFVVIIGGLVIWGMMVFMIPVFVGMLKENNSEIPAITQFVMDLSAFVTKYSIMMFLGLIVGVFTLKNFIKTPEGKIVWNRFTMKLPVFGMIIIKGELAGFASTLGTLLSSGVSLLDGLDICIEAMDNDVIASDLKEVKKKIMEGQTLGEPLSRIEYFPMLITQMVKIGEQTGQLDDMLGKIAKVFEDELEILIGEMTKMIEPFIIVVLGGCIGGMLVAMYLPMFKAAG